VTEQQTFELIVVDEPADAVRRITLNRPEKRNAINSQLRVELFACRILSHGDDAPSSVLDRLAHEGDFSRRA